jgi:hypothetical protein
MSNISTGLISRLLIPGVKTVWGMAKDYGNQYEPIYGAPIKSDKYQEYTVEMRYLGAAGIKPEGSVGQSDYAAQRFVTNFVNKTIQNSFGITKEAFNDNKYQQEFPLKTMSLKQSLTTTKNILGAAVLNNAFNVNFPMGDGKPLCSATHVIDNGTFSNVAGQGATIDFSEAGIEDGIITINQFKMQSGILEHVMPEKLIVSRADQFAAIRILKSNYQPDNANNAVNALKDGYFPKGSFTNQYLVGNPWFILTNADNGFTHFQREEVSFDSYYDFPTDVVMMKATERYCMGVSNVRAVYGSQGA